MKMFGCWLLCQIAAGVNVYFGHSPDAFVAASLVIVAMGDL